MQRNMQQTPAEVTANLPKLNRAIQKIFEISEINDTNSHKSKIKAWLHKIKQKHVDVHSYAGVKLENPPYNLESLDQPYDQNNANGKSLKNKKGDAKRQSLLQAELLKTESECISILRLCLTVGLNYQQSKDRFFRFIFLLQKKRLLPLLFAKMSMRFLGTFGSFWHSTRIFTHNYN